MNLASTTNQLLAASRDLGFSLAGACPAVTPSGFHQFVEWIELGYAGEMRYLVDRVEAYRHPQSVLDGVKSIVMLAMQYYTGEQTEFQPGQGKIARYAWGEVDYHDLIHDRLKQLKQQAQSILPGCSFRGVVDTAPLLEREFGRLAGLGWIGKNTLLLNQQSGSYFFLAALLTDAELAYNDPFSFDHCGTCTACLDACPTQAFPQPYLLDARRCISYLTIEHRSEIDHDLRGMWDDWLFGCDVCQEVCPWNRGTPTSREAPFEPIPAFRPVDLCRLFHLSDDQFRQQFRQTPMWRAKRRGVLRNAALLLGSQHYTPAIPALQKGMEDTDELVRKSCGWALNQIESGG